MDWSTSDRLKNRQKKRSSTWSVEPFILGVIFIRPGLKSKTSRLFKTFYIFCLIYCPSIHKVITKKKKKTEIINYIHLLWLATQLTLATFAVIKGHFWADSSVLISYFLSVAFLLFYNF